MPSFVPRFRLTAAIVAVLILLLMIAVLVVAIVVVPFDDILSELVLVGVVVIVAAALALGATISIRRALALRRVTRDHPDGLVFLARRQPALTSDLADYFQAHGIPTDLVDLIADRWLVALVDFRGIAVLTLGPAPVEVLLVPWSEIGTLEATDLENGARGCGISVPIPPGDPLVVSIGYAAYGFTAAVGRASVAEIVERANAQRPGA